MPVYGSFKAKNTPTFNETSPAYGAFLDMVSTISLSPTVTASRKEGTLSFKVPLAIDFGIEIGMLKIPQAFPAGSAKVTTAQGHINLLRMISLGGGGYYAEYSGQPHSMRSNAFGGFACTQLTPLPNGWIHPIVDLRWYGKPMTGQSVMFGLKLGYAP